MENSDEIADTFEPTFAREQLHGNGAREVERVIVLCTVDRGERGGKF